MKVRLLTKRPGSLSSSAVLGAFAALVVLVACGSDEDAGGDGDGDSVSFGSGGNASGDGDGDGDNPFGDGDQFGDGDFGNPFGNQGTINYQDNYLDLERPPGYPERGYAESPADEGAGEGEGEVCDWCANSSDCSGGACVIHLDTGEMFCGSSCESDDDCADPIGQECAEVDGASTGQCVRRIGSCFEFPEDAEPLNPINPPGGDGMGGMGGSN
jgi:hypothetical protein